MLIATCGSGSGTQTVIFVRYHGFCKVVPMGKPPHPTGEANQDPDGVWFYSSADSQGNTTAHLTFPQKITNIDYVLLSSKIDGGKKGIQSTPRNGAFAFWHSGWRWLPQFPCRAIPTVRGVIVPVGGLALPRNVRRRRFVRARSASLSMKGEWSQFPDSNRRPTLYESVALPTELNWLNCRKFNDLQ